MSISAPASTAAAEVDTVAAAQWGPTCQVGEQGSQRLKDLLPRPGSGRVGTEFRLWGAVCDLHVQQSPHLTKALPPGFPSFPFGPPNTLGSEPLQVAPLILYTPVSA